MPHSLQLYNKSHIVFVKLQCAKLYEMKTWNNANGRVKHVSFNIDILQIYL